MNNSHDEIRNLLNASRKMLSNDTINEDINSIRQKYGVITEQETEVSSGDITKKYDVTKSSVLFGIKSNLINQVGHDIAPFG